MYPRQKRRHRPGGAHSPKELTRARIVEAEFGLVDREGNDDITMRRLARRWRSTTMSAASATCCVLWLSMFLARPGFDGAHSDWREQIKYCFRTLRDVCLRHPRMARLLEAAGVVPAAVFVPMEVTLRALDQVGLVSHDALRNLFHAGKLHASPGVVSIARSVSRSGTLGKDPSRTACRSRIRRDRAARCDRRLGFRRSVRIRIGIDHRRSGGGSSDSEETPVDRCRYCTFQESMQAGSIVARFTEDEGRGSGAAAAAEQIN